jgi:hypothetical protein
MKIWLFAVWAATAALHAGPSLETTRDFARYIAAREAVRDKMLNGPHLLWIDQYPDLVAAAKSGETVIRTVAKKNPVDVKDGLVHDWVGTVFIPGTTLASTLALVQDYDNHKRIYQPEVVDSKTLSRNGNAYRAFLRLRKHKVITVILNSEHDVQYTPLDARRAQSRSYSTKITEIDNPGTPTERPLPPGEDHGFLWNLNSYWRFQERDGGVWVECEAISLTRDIPFGLGLVVRPIIRDLPAESLQKTLEATRAALVRP